jgi:hypothetical protein
MAAAIEISDLPLAVIAVPTTIKMISRNNWLTSKPPLVRAERYSDDISILIFDKDSCKMGFLDT